MQEQAQQIPDNQSTSLPIARHDKRIKGIPLELLIGYAKKDLTHEEIAQLVGCSKPNVTQRLVRSGYHTIRGDAYEKHRTTLLRFRQSELLNSITQAKLKETSIRDAVVAYGILHDKELDLTQGRVSGPQVNVIQAQALQAGQDMTLVDAELTKIRDEIAKLMPQADVIDV
jgi:hypothetical protein